MAHGGCATSSKGEALSLLAALPSQNGSHEEAVEVGKEAMRARPLSCTQ